MAEMGALCCASCHIWLGEFKKWLTVKLVERNWTTDTPYSPNFCHFPHQETLHGPPPWALVFRLAHQVALGINFLHNLSPALLHLDLKPSNVLLDSYLNAKVFYFVFATWHVSSPGLLLLFCSLLPSPWCSIHFFPPLSSSQILAFPGITTVSHALQRKTTKRKGGRTATCHQRHLTYPTARPEPLISTGTAGWTAEYSDMFLLVSSIIATNLFDY